MSERRHLTVSRECKKKAVAACWAKLACLGGGTRMNALDEGNYERRKCKQRGAACQNDQYQAS